MYVVTFFFALAYAFMKTLKHAEAHQRETSKPLEWSNRISYFIVRFVPILIAIWIIETYIYYKLLTMEPTP